MLWSLLAVKIKPVELQCIFIRVLDIEMQNNFKCKGSGMILFKPSVHKRAYLKPDQVVQGSVQSDSL